MIICQVTGAAITVAQNELLTTGMVQAVPVRFCFSPQWAALEIRFHRRHRQRQLPAGGG